MWDHYKVQKLESRLAQLNQAVNIYNDYWDCIPEKERVELDKRLKAVDCQKMKLEKSLLGDRPIVETMLAKEMVEAFDIILAIMKDKCHHANRILCRQDLKKLEEWRKELPEECEGCGSKGEDLPCWCFEL